MQKNFAAAVLMAGLLATGLAATAVTAAPVPVLPTQQTQSDVQTVQGYHRDCVWVNKGWRYRDGERYVDCRPRRPLGFGWIWRNEGERFGWYNNRRNNWYFNGW